MDQGAAQYRIRLARLDELPRLREIEDRAGTMFSGLGLIADARDVSFPPEDLRTLIGLRQVWVACETDDVLVGMVIAPHRLAAWPLPPLGCPEDQATEVAGCQLPTPKAIPCRAVWVMTASLRMLHWSSGCVPAMPMHSLRSSGRGRR